MQPAPIKEPIYEELSIHPMAMVWVMWFAGAVNALSIHSGTTAQRPTPGRNDFFVYFDTTLAAAGKPIFWTGTQWVDATGAVV